MGAFPIASVLGVPAGLFLAAQFSWHAPFFMLAAVATPVMALAVVALPRLHTGAHHHPLQQMRAIVAHGVHLRAFAVGAVLVMVKVAVSEPEYDR